MSIFATLLTACLGTLILTPLVGNLAGHLGIVDQPNWRKVHRQPMPRLGGVAVYVSWMLGLQVAMLFGGEDLANSNMITMANLAAMVVCLGIIDDWRDVSGSAKLSAQIFIATLVFLAGERIEQISNPLGGIVTLPLPISYTATVLWIVGMMNAMNLIDGLDGLAAGVSVIMAYGLMAASASVGSETPVLMLAALAGACLGFLRYNFNPARIFLGDSGSQFLGFVFAVAPLLEDQFKAAAAVTFLIPLSVMTLPIFDTGLAIYRRIRGRKSLFRGDRYHLHHRLLKMGLTHRQAVLFFYLLTIYLSVFSFLFVLIKERYALVLLILLGLGLLMGMQTLRFIEWTLRRRMREEKANRRR